MSNGTEKNTNEIAAVSVSAPPAGGGKTCLVLYNAIPKSVEPAEVEKTDNAYVYLNEERTEVAAIRDALKANGYVARTMGIRSMGPKTILKIDETNPDIIFNLVEMVRDESKTEMCIAGVYDLLRTPYTGSPPFALGLALNKVKAKQVMRGAGIPVAPGVVVRPGEEVELGSLQAPYIVKPIREDGSAGITRRSVAKKAEECAALVKAIHEEYHQPALVEEYIDGREFTVYIIGNDEARVLAVAEIDYSKMPKRDPRIISYDAKWASGAPEFIGSEIVFPTDLDAALKARIEKIALKAYREIGIRDYGRVDLRASKEGKLYVLEANPNPDIAPESGYERAAQVAGLSYIQVVGEIAGYALARKSRKAEREFTASKIVV